MAGLRPAGKLKRAPPLRTRSGGQLAVVEHLLRQKMCLDHEAAQLGGELDFGIARIERQHLPGESEEEAGSGTDLARHHTRLYDILAFGLQTAETFETVEIVLLLAA